MILSAIAAGGGGLASMWIAGWPGWACFLIGAVVQALTEERARRA